MENLDVVEVNPYKNVLFVILLYKNEKFGVRAPYDLDILGKKMWEWVALSGSGAKIKTTPCTEESDVLGLIKPFVTDEEIVVVLYSDTPLVSKLLMLEILENFKAKKQNVLKLKRGFVFDANYLLSADSVIGAENKMFNVEEFDMIDSFEKLAVVTETIKNNILAYHMANGVYIVDKKSTFIDADVVIEKGVKIEPNNKISGECYIGEGSVLEPNNIIKNSIICNNVVIKNSYVSNSQIVENTIVGPFESVIDRSV